MIRNRQFMEFVSESERVDWGMKDAFGVRQDKIARTILEPYVIEGKKILEIGVARNSMKHYFPQAVKTLDIMLVTKPDIVADAENMKPVKKESFDIIYSSHFLEHSYRPEKVMSECHRVLKKRGIIFFVVPVVKLDKLWKDEDDWNTHQHHFTKENIKNLLDGLFRLVHFEYRLWVKPYFLETILGNLTQKGDIIFIAEKI